MTVKELVELLKKFPEDYVVESETGKEIWVKMNGNLKKIIVTD